EFPPKLGEAEISSSPLPEAKSETRTARSNSGFDSCRCGDAKGPRLQQPSTSTDSESPTDAIRNHLENRPISTTLTTLTGSGFRHPRPTASRMTVFCFSNELTSRKHDP